MRTLKQPVWILLGAVGAFVVLHIILPYVKVIPGSVIAYGIEPVMAAMVGGMAWYFAHGMRDRVRHTAEKALIVGSAIAVWFVLYFASGIVFTYQHNAVASSVTSIALNVVAFGLVAVALEYTRHAIMLLAGRRNVIWLGVIVGIVFAAAQLSVLQLMAGSAMDAIQNSVATIIPTIAMSFVLTYLSFNAGFSAQLTYRLGVLAAALLPPIIPKLDWYMTGISSLILAVAVYIAIDRTREDIEITGRRYHHAKRAYDISFLIAMVALVLFMTGFFSYKPTAIMSDSMKPVFSRGSMVIIQKITAVDVQVGDIIQYQMPGHTITHRIIRTEQAADGSGSTLYITQGDNSPSADAPVKADQVIGVVRAQIPYIGYLSVWLSEAMQ